jgi:hypothetical protein
VSLPEVADGDLLIARLWRWDTERLQKDAETVRRLQLAEGVEVPECLVSAWGMLKDPSVSTDELGKSLCEHILQYRRSKYIAFTTQSRIEDKGFHLRQDPPEFHYNVILGTDFEQADFEGLAGLFEDDGGRRVDECLQ